MLGWLRFGEGAHLFCQLALNESSTFTIPYLEHRPLQRTSSIGRAASKVSFTQASKTSDLLSEMGLVSTVSAISGINLSIRIDHR